MKKAILLLSVLFSFSAMGQITTPAKVTNQPAPVTKNITIKTVEDTINATTFVQDSAGAAFLITKTAEVIDTTVLKTPVEIMLAKKLVTNNVKSDSTIKALTPPTKPEPDAKPIAWLEYIIALAAIVVVWLTTRWPAVNKWMLASGNQLLIRLASETTSFLNKIGITCFTIASAITGILTAGLFTGEYIISILKSICIICFAIAGTVMVTKKSAPVNTPDDKK
jgi:hypothetical protein